MRGEHRASTLRIRKSWQNGLESVRSESSCRLFLYSRLGIEKTARLAVSGFSPAQRHKVAMHSQPRAFVQIVLYL